MAAIPILGWRRGAETAAVVAVGLGKVIGFAARRSRLLPGLAGAAMVAYGVAMISLPAGVITGGIFLLAMDRQISLRKPRE